MRNLQDSVWKRRGISWLWGNKALSSVTDPSEVFSLRNLMRVSRNWPEDLPSNNGDALVVAGLDVCLDLLTPEDADNWLNTELKSVVLSFQEKYSGEAALIFWLPSGQRRFCIKTTSDAVFWKCAHPNPDQLLEFGRILWGQAGEYPQRIVMGEECEWAGLFHLRIT